MVMKKSGKKVVGTHLILMSSKEYKDLLQDDRWKRKSLKIRNRDFHTCQHCGIKGVELHVHHKRFLFEYVKSCSLQFFFQTFWDIKQVTLFNSGVESLFSLPSRSFNCIFLNEVTTKSFELFTLMSLK